MPNEDSKNINKFTPKFLIGGIVLFLIVAAVFIMYKPATKNYSEAPSESPTLAANAEISGDVGEYYDGTKSATASSAANPIPTPQPISVYEYPGADKDSATENKIEMTSSDSPANISNWYKKKIKEVGFNAVSAASADTNGDIFNKISAAKPGEKIEVSIKKDQSASKTTITVDRL